jgi:hypothetical protein
MKLLLLGIPPPGVALIVKKGDMKFKMKKKEIR